MVISIDLHLIVGSYKRPQEHPPEARAIPTSRAFQESQEGQESQESKVTLSRFLPEGVLTSDPLL